MESPAAPQIITRIFIDTEGNLTVSDLWQEVAELLGPSFSAEVDPAGWCPLKHGQEQTDANN